MFINSKTPLENILQQYSFYYVGNSEFYEILVFCVISVLLAVIIVGASMLLSPKEYYGEKLTAYECGFDPFDDSRNQFDVRFYLVAILFIIFDLEIAFLFPGAVHLIDQTGLAVGALSIFLTILTAGFVYEWQKDALEWE